ncbi:MAG: hypothetical protein ABWZ25_17275 [Chitinophagaceae bacterium]
MRKLKLILGFFAMTGQYAAFSQPFVPGDETHELQRISKMYGRQNSLSFDITWQYRDTISQILPDEQMSAHYRLSEGRYHARFDSLEIIQGFNYNLVVYHDMKIIVLSKPQVLSKAMFQVSVLDTLFQQNLLSAMTVTIKPDSSRVLNIRYGPGEKFEYQVFYKPSTYRIDSVKYAAPDPNSDSGVQYIVARYGNYSTAAIDESCFMEGKFVYNDGSRFFLKPGFSTYELTVNGDLNNSDQ